MGFISWLSFTRALATVLVIIWCEMVLMATFRTCSATTPSSKTSHVIDRMTNKTTDRTAPCYPSVAHISSASMAVFLAISPSQPLESPSSSRTEATLGRSSSSLLITRPNDHHSSLSFQHHPHRQYPSQLIFSHPLIFLRIF